ncbi:unc-13-like protein [Thalictrum thalictroides]|uniref:Unc-13-like protein n=1 Tax=Thalictrum thalictroides TaxID=46969 RepID=A0A7J6WXC5_THATH|nr:unc-13-like protein [Thalictrum thalictroides]
MARLFRDNKSQSSSKKLEMQTSITCVDLPSPFGELNCKLSDLELRETAYEIFVSVTRFSTSSSGGKPLTYISQSDKSLSSSPSSNGNSSSSPSSISPSFQRSLTSTAASKMKQAFGMKSSNKSPPTKENGSNGSPLKSKKPMTVGDLVRVQMGVSEQSDSRIRRALLRISAGQVGRRIESLVLPLELLQQFKSTDFSDQQEYEAWRMRNLNFLEVGLLSYPHVPLEKSSSASSRLRQIIQGASDRPIETGKNNESMQILRSAVMALAYRSSNGIMPETCHWADGFPLNLRLYQMLLEACFDANEQTSIVEEIDEVIELIKKTWVILGMNQLLHNLCFTWVLFHRYVTSGQVEKDLLFAADKQLAEVAKDAKATKDPVYSKILSSTLSSILGWTEKRLLAYHDTFALENIEIMQSIVSLGVNAAKILVEDISHEYRRRRKGEVDVARDRIDTYIRSSLRTAFAQRMEMADSSRRSSKNQPNSLPMLSILAKDIGELAVQERDLFSPVLKRWHPLAAGVAVATLHTCYGNELKQFILGITELTPDAVKVLRAAHKLEQDLVQIAVEDAVDSDDGGKAVIREMPPFEAEAAIANMVKVWIKTRVDRTKEWVDNNLQQEVWNHRANSEKYAPSVVEVLRIIDETLEAFFLLPIPTHVALLPDLMTGLDRTLLHYISKTKSGCGSRNTFLPALPALTRSTIGSKIWTKKDKLQHLQKRKSQVGTLNGDTSFSTAQLCVRMNTLQHMRLELEVLEKRTVTYLRNTESASADDIANGLGKKFELSPGACLEGFQQLCETMAYKVIFRDLSHVLWDGLYVGEPSSTRIEPMLKELEQELEVISEIIHSNLRNRVITDIMKASFDGFLLVLLAGGCFRSFSRRDSQIIEDDFGSLKDLYWSNGDGLPNDLIDNCSRTVREILPLFRTDTQSLIDRFRRTTLETYGPSAKARFPLPPTSGQWSPTEPNTILRILCHRNDEEATKYLKKTYNLPKKV